MTAENDAAILQAARRVGSRAEEQFAWLYGLAARDVSQLTPGELNEVRLEMLVFVASQTDFERSLVGLEAPDASGAVRMIYEGVRAGFDNLKRTGVFKLPARVIDGVEWREASVALGVPGAMVPVAYGTADQRFFAAVVALLVTIGPQLRACDNPKCERLFLREGRKRYCRPACSQQVRTDKYRLTHPAKVSNWRHTEYERKQRKKHGKPRLKVARRRSPAKPRRLRVRERRY